MARRKSLLAGLGVAAVLGLSVLTAAPAMAGELSTGSHSCSAGSVKLTANSTQATFMRLNAGGQSKVDTKPGNANASVKVLYSSFGATTSGGASTGGTLYSLKNGCDY